ncbi:MAG TPA: hypothetical protein VH413_06340 [Verrucomicrobiae bacterium]|jgi:hypothetical protein|nr:hypothetical protein [Verrucomicrobiae bacterium]
MKKLLAAILVVVVIALVCWLALADRKSPPLASFVRLPDGSLVRIVAVTYGTNHVIGSPVARVASRLPLFLRDILSEMFGARVQLVGSTATATPQLLVWLDQRTNGPSLPPLNGYCEAVLGDGNDFSSGGQMGLNSMPMSQVYPLYFDAFPRRDRQMTLNIFYHDAKGIAHLTNRLFFNNPLSQTYPQWQAEPLPATHRAGDVEVTLLGMETGHDGSVSFIDGGALYGTNRSDGRNSTAVNLKLRSLSNSNEIWQVAGVEISDATGNHINSSSMTWSGQSASFAFSPSLWPSEAAWKIKFEVKKSGGFSPEEMFVFKNVPLGELDRTNVLEWTTNAAGISATLESISRRAPIKNGAWSSSQVSTVSFHFGGLSPGTQLDLLQMVCDSGKTNHSESWSSSGSERSYSFREIPLKAKTADFTFAVQRSRTVEFIAKPELPKAQVKK